MESYVRFVKKILSNDAFDIHPAKKGKGNKYEEPHSYIIEQ